MLQIIKSAERGRGDHGWLTSRHTFSFADYYNPNLMGFRSLRVINEDRINGGTGFGSHSHRDMEIISYVVSGLLEHKDSMGNETTIQPGEVQRMSAGSGIVHSEHNGSKDSEAHFYQIWILPKNRGIEPGYGQKSFSEELARNQLVLAVSPDGKEGSIAINQDAYLYLAQTKNKQTFSYPLKAGRGAWLQLVSGSLDVSGHRMGPGDGLAVSEEANISMEALESSAFMLFDLA